MKVFANRNPLKILISMREIMKNLMYLKPQTELGIFLLDIFIIL